MNTAEYNPDNNHAHAVAPNSTTKSEVATELLNWAICSFLSWKGYYSAIQLSGAAEEIFAVYLRSPTYQEKSSADELKSLFVHLCSPKNQREEIEVSKWFIDRLNAARNSVKHKQGHGDEYVHFDPEREAEDSIRRAINNYTQLSRKTSLPPVDSILDFYAALKIKASQEA